MLILKSINNLHPVKECMIVLCSGSVHSEIPAAAVQKNVQIGRLRHETFKNFCQVIRKYFPCKVN